MTKKQTIANIKMLVHKYASITPLELGNVYNPKNRFNNRIVIDSSGIVCGEDYGEFYACLPPKRGERASIVVTGWFENGEIHFDHRVAVLPWVA